MDFYLRRQLPGLIQRSRQTARAAAVAAAVALTTFTMLGAGLALTTAPASASAGGLPVIRSLWEQVHWAGYPRQEMFVRLHIDNASSARIVGMQGYAPKYDPNAPCCAFSGWHVVVTAGSLVLKHTGPGNLWNAHSYDHKLVLAVASAHSTTTVHACNASGCITQTFRLSLLP